MSNYFKKTQKRAIINDQGLFIVKTSGMLTYHRSFEDACDAYHMVYGQVPIAGPLDLSPKVKAIEPDTTTKVDISTREATFNQMADTYAEQVKSFEAVMRKSHGIVQKVAEERMQRMKDRVRYCETMTLTMVSQKAA